MLRRMSDDTRALLDERAIRETLSRYCRGVDRMDRALTRSCWHEDGSADYRGMFAGGADALLDWMWKLHEQMETHSHQITNVLIELAGDRAVSEAYVTVVLRTKPGRAPARDLWSRGRYVDRWSRRDGRWAIDQRRSRRDGRWAIDQRLFLNDWATSLPAGDEPGAPFSGRRDSADASYAVFAELRARR
jgi:hypothetical protein